MENIDEEVQQLEKQMKKLRLKFKRAFDNKTGLRLTPTDIALLNLGILAEWAECVFDDDA